jgi:glycerol-3-phosphate acyltransferase PlsY
VATAAGVFFALAPAVAGVAAGVFAVVAAIGRVVSVASLLATLALCLAAFTLDRRPEVGILAIALTALIFLRHTGNLRRLLRREETGL